MLVKDGFGTGSIELGDWDLSGCFFRETKKADPNVSGSAFCTKKTLLERRLDRFLEDLKRYIHVLSSQDERRRPTNRVRSAAEND
jgi:hypothetical protein